VPWVFLQALCAAPLSTPGLRGPEPPTPYLQNTPGLSGTVDHLGWSLPRIGWEVAPPQASMFVWARFPQIEDSLALAETAQRDGIMLAPGTVFRPHLERSPWMRFNIAICEDPRVQARLQRLATSAAG